MSITEGAASKTISGSQVIFTGTGVVHGFIVNSHSTGTLKLYDSISASGTVLVNTFTFPTGSSVQQFPAPLVVSTGLYAEMSADESITLVYNQT